MRTVARAARCCLLLASALAVFLAVTATRCAAVDYPASGTLFSVDVPEGWTSDAGDDGIKLISPNPRNELTIRFTKGEGTDLKLATEKHIDGFKSVGAVTDTTVGAPVEGELDGMKTYTLVMTGKDFDKKDTAITVTSFQAGPTIFMINYTARPEMAEKYQKEIASILASVKKK